VTARRSLTREGAGAVTETKNYVYEYLNTDISKKEMIPAVATVKPRSLEEYGEFSRHHGEEFVIILDGEVELHTEHYQPVRMAKGDSTYIDSTMPHAMISVSKEPARILFVCTHAIAEHEASVVSAMNAPEPAPAAARRGVLTKVPPKRARRA
jgi:mannose-6-phosphate isomerase-like protein (cupin superfamily)